MRVPQVWLNEIAKGTQFGQKAAAAVQQLESQVTRSKRAMKSVKTSRHRELVGDAMETRIEGLLKIKTGHGCGCKTLAKKMNVWGIAGCERNRPEIIQHLVSNRDVLVQALQSSGRWIQAAGAAIAPDIILRVGADSLLSEAIESVRNQAPIIPRISRQPRTQPKTQQVKRPRTPHPKKPLIQRSKSSVNQQISRQSGHNRWIGKLAEEQLRLYNINLVQPPPSPDPFDDTPVIHFGAHLWPIRGNWEWHIEKWNKLSENINGKCIVGIATDNNTSTIDDVKSLLSDKFEIFSLNNITEGENPTFRQIQNLVPDGQNDILIYAHGKGVRSHTAISKAVRMWTEIMYETVVFNHKDIIDKMSQGYKNFHSFRTFGTRPLTPVNSWHPSGTFFAVRAKYLRGKVVKTRYGGVEAWCGDHFTAAESWCEFYDNSMFTTLYNVSDMENIVWPMFEEWRKTN